MGNFAKVILYFHMWSYELTLKFCAKIKEYFLTHDSME